MTQDEKSVAEQYSSGKISRKEASRLLGQDISYSDMLIMLGKYELPLPRPKVDPNSEGVQALTQLLRQQKDE